MPIFFGDLRGFSLRKKFLKALFEVKEGISDEIVDFNIKNVKLRETFINKLLS